MLTFHNYFNQPKLPINFLLNTFIFSYIFLKNEVHKVSAFEKIKSRFVTKTKQTRQQNILKAGPFSGYLPMFGPCFVNFYGAPREYSDLASEFEDLNLGKVSSF